MAAQTAKVVWLVTKVLFASGVEVEAEFEQQLGTSLQQCEEKIPSVLKLIWETKLETGAELLLYNAECIEKNPE